MFVLFLRRHFVEEQEVSSRNVGCFLRVQMWRPMQGVDFRRMYSSIKYVSRDILGFVNKDSYFSALFLCFRTYFKAFFSRP